MKLNPKGKLTMNYKDLAASVELTEYCMIHDYSITWCRWLDNIIFTRYSDGSEFTPKAGATAAKIFKVIQEARGNSSLDPLIGFLEPVKPASLDIIL